MSIMSILSLFPNSGISIPIYMIKNQCCWADRHTHFKSSSCNYGLNHCLNKGRTAMSIMSILSLFPNFGISIPIYMIKN